MGCSILVVGNNTNAETEEKTRKYLQMNHHFNEDGKVTR